MPVNKKDYTFCLIATTLVFIVSLLNLWLAIKLFMHGQSRFFAYLVFYIFFSACVLFNTRVMKSIREALK